MWFLYPWCRVRWSAEAQSVCPCNGPSAAPVNPTVIAPGAHPARNHRRTMGESVLWQATDRSLARNALHIDGTYTMSKLGDYNVSSYSINDEPNQWVRSTQSIRLRLNKSFSPLLIPFSVEKAQTKSNSFNIRIVVVVKEFGPPYGKANAKAI